MEQQEEITKPGKPWKKDSFHQNYESADALRSKLLRIWSNNDDHKGMEVKIHFLPSKNQFVVKTRLHPDFETNKGKKNGKKNRKSRKRDSNKRKIELNETSV